MSSIFNDFAIDVWLNSLSEDTKKKYLIVISDFKVYHESQENMSLSDASLHYISNFHDLGMAASSLWSKISILKNYYLTVLKTNIYIFGKYCHFQVVEVMDKT
jgi:hypothetical protein